MYFFVNSTVDGNREKFEKIWASWEIGKIFITGIAGSVPQIKKRRRGKSLRRFDIVQQLSIFIQIIGIGGRASVKLTGFDIAAQIQYIAY